METEHVALAPISCCILYKSIRKKIMLCAWTHISWFCSYNWHNTLKTCLVHTKALCLYHHPDGTFPGDIRMQTTSRLVGTYKGMLLFANKKLASFHSRDRQAFTSQLRYRQAGSGLDEFRKQDGQLHPFWQIWLKRRRTASLMFLGLDLHGHHSLVCGLGFFFKKEHLDL